MILTILYLLIAFVITFYNVKNHWDKMEKESDGFVPYPFTKSGFKIFIFPVLWLPLTPFYMLWQLMEKIYKLTNKNNKPQ